MTITATDPIKFWAAWDKMESHYNKQWLNTRFKFWKRFVCDDWLMTCFVMIFGMIFNIFLLGGVVLLYGASGFEFNLLMIPISSLVGGLFYRILLCIFLPVPLAEWQKVPIPPAPKNLDDPQEMEQYNAAMNQYMVQITKQWQTK